VHDHKDQRCNRHAGPCPTGIWLCQADVEHNRDCYQTRVPATSLVNSLNGWVIKKWGTSGGAPYHPQTQGKIERWHQTLKNRILLENDFFPADLEIQIEAFVDHYNHHRYHESINNLTPADIYFGRGQAILKQRERIKLKTMEARRLQCRKCAA
jgi:putative transposase